MSNPTMHAFEAEMFEDCGRLWDSNNLSQRNLWIMFSDAPLNTPLEKQWHDLPEYHRTKIFASYVEAVL